MAERIDWLDDGTASGAPFSPRFDDRYRGELGGIKQSKEVFLAGCGLPAAWSGQPDWKILETGFGLGLNFLVTWAAWKADPLRSRLLHFVSVEAFPAAAADVLRSASAHPELVPLATQLHAQLWGLLPGFHRLVFEGGHVLLTLCIGDAKAMLREQLFEADSVYLDGFSPQKNPGIWDLHTLKALARCCKRGTRIASWTVARPVRDALTQCGFEIEKTPGIAPKRDNLAGQYNPPWTPKKPTRAAAYTPRPPTRCVVIGAGLAGSAVAASLARRGWRVMVLDAADAPASGASSLPAGLLVPHVSPDDSWLSKLSRSGVRLTMQQAQSLLARDTDWAHTGVLQRDVGSDAHDLGPRLPANWAQDWPDAAAEWSEMVSADKWAQTGMDASSKGLWHARAGWIKPARLVAAWLKAGDNAATIEWRGNAKVARLLPGENNHGWQAVSDSGEVLAQADLVVLAAAYDSRALAASVTSAAPELQPIRGQLSWGLHAASETSAAGSPALPPFPINGHGSLIPAVPMQGGAAWVAGASFERDCAVPGIKLQDHLENLARLQTLLPEAATSIENQFSQGQLRGWAGIRCATPSRLPLVARVAQGRSGDEVWVCSGMGSRGLTFAALCGELLAARLHAEPLPVEQRLAQAMGVAVRQTRMVAGE
jgi:tRNA 5-methylaminomethyl-2-thiouridine biosynthesis bifunctional protein